MSRESTALSQCLPKAVATGPTSGPSWSSSSTSWALQAVPTNLIIKTPPLCFRPTRTPNFLATAAAYVGVLPPQVVSAWRALSAPSSLTLVSRSARHVLQVNSPSTVDGAKCVRLEPSPAQAQHSAPRVHLVNSHRELGKLSAT